MEDNKFVLEVSDLHTTFKTDNGDVSAVNGVSFKLEPGKTLGIVGESGSGKSVTAYSIMQILAENGAITGGSVKYKGEDITKWNKKKMADFRGKCCSIIFQDPMTSLNPVMTVGEQIAEAIEYHNSTRDDEQQIPVDERVNEVLEMVGIPASRKDEYPHQFSGGMKQRVVIAMALSCEPELLIADEPTTALDVTIQAQVLAMMSELRDKLGTAMILITHDLGIVASICDKVAIMYAGKIIEAGTLEDIYVNKEHHPYTVGLFGAIPNLKVETKRLAPIEGLMPDPSDLPSGCYFHDRCPHCMEICKKEYPEVYTDGTHSIACHLFTKKGVQEETNE